MDERWRLPVPVGISELAFTASLIVDNSQGDSFTVQPNETGSMSQSYMIMFSAEIGGFVTWIEYFDRKAM